RLLRISIFVFIDIPASFPLVEYRPFLFIDIPGLFRQKQEFLFELGRLPWAAGQIERVMLGRASGKRTFIPQSPVPSPQSLAPSPQPLFFFPDLPHTTYLCFHRHSRFVPSFLKVTTFFSPCRR